MFGHTVVVPEIIPGFAGVAGFTITAKLLGPLVPQLFCAVTSISPSTAAFEVETVIVFVVEPAVMFQPEGTDQLYEVAFGTVDTE